MAQLHLLYHAERIPVLSGRATVVAALVAGSAFLLLWLVLAPLVLGQSPMIPARMIAALALGRDVLPPPGGFDLGVVVVALVIHAILALVLAFLFVPTIFRLRPSPALVLGIVFGMVVYFVNFYGFAVLFPWFTEQRNGVNVLTHVVFGFTLAWAYRWWVVRQSDQGEGALRSGRS